MSKALTDFTVSLQHADNLIKGTKTGVGKPTSQEASMFVASVALTYAAWETYVEDVAVEVTAFLAEEVEPSKVPATARAAIERESPTPWELSVHPGWRELWKDRVATTAKGDDSNPDKPRFGMNTARTKQIIDLFQDVGLDFMGVIGREDRSALEKLVTARGTVVHSAATPASFNKGTAKKYRDLVERMATAADESIRAQAEKLAGSSPWT